MALITQLLGHYCGWDGHATILEMVHLSKLFVHEYAEAIKSVANVLLAQTPKFSQLSAAAQQLFADITKRVVPDMFLN